MCLRCETLTAAEKIWNNSSNNKTNNNEKRIAFAAFKYFDFQALMLLVYTFIIHDALANV